MEAGLQAIEVMPADWSGASRSTSSPFGYPDDEIDAVIDAHGPTAGEGGRAACARHPDHGVARRPRLRAVQQHRLADRGRRSTTCSPPETAGDRDDRGWETDLLAGLNLD